METLNKCILNYRQPKSAAFTEAPGNLKKTGRMKVWVRPGWGTERGPGDGEEGGGGEHERRRRERRRRGGKYLGRM